MLGERFGRRRDGERVLRVQSSVGKRSRRGRGVWEDPEESCLSSRRGRKTKCGDGDRMRRLAREASMQMRLSWLECGPEEHMQACPMHGPTRASAIVLAPSLLLLAGLRFA